MPAGQVTVTVSYTGTQPASATLVVSAGQTATRDFELQSTVFNQSLRPGTASDQVVTLGAFVVSSEREGNAKAIMDQRAALNAKSVVATDNYGDLTMGDVARFDPDEGHGASANNANTRLGTEYSHRHNYNDTYTIGPKFEYKRDSAVNGWIWGRERTLVDLSGGYKISKRLEIMLSVRNLFNTPYQQYSNEPGRLQMFDVYGSLWNFGIKGTF